jgi:hypothetical protein
VEYYQLLDIMEIFISCFPENDLFTAKTEIEASGVTLVAPEKEKKHNIAQQ